MAAPKRIALPPFLWYCQTQENVMGTVYTEITLKNTSDVDNADRGIIPAKDVREITVRALADTGAGTLVINEAVRQKLGLRIKGQRRAERADGTKQVYQVTEPVEVHWKDRESTCRALVLPEAGEALLGAIPLEDMDLIVDPAGQEVKGAHGDKILCLIK
jgi:clan AA aspartic protease